MVSVLTTITCGNGFRGRERECSETIASVAQ